MVLNCLLMGRQYLLYFLHYHMINLTTKNLAGCSRLNDNLRCNLSISLILFNFSSYTLYKLLSINSRYSRIPLINCVNIY